ncbi:MAG: hypothetical protein ABW220_02805, partial [Burkholderiaceae bacterium]
DRIILADGAVGFLGCTPYGGFTGWCEDSGLDYFVFGWDWRRKLQHSGRFFVEKFLPFFQEMVKDGCNNADPLERFSLIGHSAGGMVVNWIFRQNHPGVANMHRAITVATPFYGYASQLHRWFEGEPYLHGPFGVFKEKIVKAISSMPACYTWLYLGKKTYDANHVALAADPDYPLATYPCMDKTVPTVVADPYDPREAGNRSRYPSAAATGFDRNELKRAGRLVARLAGDFEPGLPLDKFFNVRCDDEKNDTAGSSTWSWIPPAQPSPIDDVTTVAGDGTQPGWTARHVGLQAARPDQVKTVVASDAGHMFTMNSPRTIEMIAGILGVTAPAPVAELKLEIASSQEALQFVRDLQVQFPGKVRGAPDKERLRATLAKTGNRKLRAIARRIMIDLLRPPLRDPGETGRTRRTGPRSKPPRTPP